jgi:hypothetical protein
MGMKMFLDIPENKKGRGTLFPFKFLLFPPKAKSVC